MNHAVHHKKTVPAHGELAYYKRNDSARHFQGYEVYKVCMNKSPLCRPRNGVFGGTTSSNG